MCKFSEITCCAALEGWAVHCKAFPPANIIQSNNHSRLPTWLDIVPEEGGLRPRRVPCKRLCEDKNYALAKQKNTNNGKRSIPATVYQNICFLKTVIRLYYNFYAYNTYLRRMNFKIVLKYIFLYLVLNSTGLLIAYRFWWTDELTLSYFDKEVAALLLSTGACWIGVVYLSISITRKIRLRQDNFKFIGLIDIQNTEMLRSKLDNQTRKKLRFTLPFIAFPLMIATITIFIFSMGKVKESQLENYGKVEMVTVKSIHKDIKGNPYAYMEYNNGNAVNLPKNNLEVNDQTEIIYSSKNPDIVTYYQSNKQK